MLGILYETQNNKNAALECYNKSAEIDSNNLSAINNQANLLLRGVFV